MAITQTQAKRVLVLSMVGTGTVVIVGRVAKGRAPEPRIFIALGFVYIVIAVMTDVEPNVAGPLAGLVFLTALLSFGTDAFGGVDTALKRPWRSVAPEPGFDPLESTDPIQPITPIDESAGGAMPRLVELPKQYTQDGKRVLVQQSVIAEVEQICKKFGVKVSSGYRTRAHNIAVGGAKSSDHLCGAGIDFVPFKKNLHTWALNQHFPYVEPTSITKSHVHISFYRCSQRRQAT